MPVLSPVAQVNYTAAFEELCWHLRNRTVPLADRLELLRLLTIDQPVIPPQSAGIESLPNSRQTA
jgi:hypothetical protein